MTYTKQHADENRELRRIAKDALEYVGWKPDPEPREWRTLASLAQAELANGFPEIPASRIRHQVLRVMAEYRGYRKGEWE